MKKLRTKMFNIQIRSVLGMNEFVVENHWNHCPVCSTCSKEVLPEFGQEVCFFKAVADMLKY